MLFSDEVSEWCPILYPVYQTDSGPGYVEPLTVAKIKEMIKLGNFFGDFHGRGENSNCYFYRVS